MKRYDAYDPFADAYNRHWGGFSTWILPVIDRLLLAEVEEGARILDLCCGSGQLAASLTERGYRVIGVDGSEAMISHARANAPAAEFRVADARSFTLESPAAAAVSTFDSLNHLMTLEDLARAFASTRAALVPGAPFLFDLNMEEGFRTRWRGSAGVVADDEVIVAISSYDPDTASGRVDLTLMVQAAAGWQRRDISLSQRCYSEKEVRGALAAAGFGDVEVFDTADLDLSDVGRSFFRSRAG